MNTQQALQWESDVIASAKQWLTGDSSIDNQHELLVLAEYYKVKLPSCMYHFRYSRSPNDVCASGALKTIYRTMDKLATAIKKREVN